MKKLRKVVTGVLALAMIFALTACGGKEQSLTFRAVQEQDGVTITDEITLEAKGDKVQKMIENIVVDTTVFDEAQKEQVNAIYDEMAASYQSVEGVECISEAGENSYTMNIVIDTTGSAVDELAEKGLLQMEGGSNGISLKASQAGLEANGYSLVE